MCPVIARDAARLAILLRSLTWFLDSGCLRELLLVCPDRDRAIIERVVLHRPVSFRVRIASEEDWLADIDPAADSRALEKWYLQQILKLAAWKHVRTPHYLVLDADLICCRQVNFAALFPGGRAAMSWEPKDSQKWWQASSALLGVPLGEPMGMNVTPEIFYVDQVRGLLRHLEVRHRRGWVAVLSANPVKPGDGWSEFSLYSQFVESEGLMDRLYAPDRPLFVYGGVSIWNHDVPANWDYRAAFLKPGQRGFFIVVQSWTGLPARWIWRRIAPFFSTRAVRPGRRPG